MKFRLAVFVLITILLFSVLHLYFNTQNISLKYQVAGLKTEHNQLLSRNRQTASQIARQENLAHVEKVAREKLSMDYPSKMNYIVAPPGSPAGTAATSRP